MVVRAFVSIGVALAAFGRWRGLWFELAQICDDAAPALGLFRLADISAVQDEPVMDVADEFGSCNALKAEFHLQRIFAGRKPRSVGDAKDVSIDRDGWLPEGHIQDDIRGLAANAGQLLKGLAVLRDFAAVL